MNREAIKAQQLALKHLGYYSGEVDGIWSRKSIEAKIAFERSGKYNPCVPNNGMPFVEGHKLPPGLMVNGRGFIEAIDKPQETKTAIQDIARSEHVKQEQPKVEQKNEQPKVEQKNEQKIEQPKVEQKPDAPKADQKK